MKNLIKIEVAFFSYVNTCFCFEVYVTMTAVNSDVFVFFGTFGSAQRAPPHNFLFANLCETLFIPLGEKQNLQ